MRVALLVVLTGCDAVFGVTHRAPVDAPSADASDDAALDASPSAACPDPTLQVCLTFEEGSASFARDGTLNANHAAMENVTVGGREGSPAIEVASTSSVSLITDVGLDIDRDLTFALWARIDSRPTPPALEVLFDNDMQYRLVLRNGTRVGCNLTTSPSGGVEVGEAIAPGWRHVACVRELGSLRLYIDGTAVAMTTVTLPTNTGDRVPVQIGQDGDPDGAMNPFTGGLDEVRVYNRALSQAELTTLAN